MGLYHEAIANFYNDETRNCAWIITRDHLAEEFNDDTSEVGVIGPSDAPEECIKAVKAGKGHVFRMYDDDDELYYTGRLFTTGDMNEEGNCLGPLDDFGTPNAGATQIRWHGHKEWDN